MLGIQLENVNIYNLRPTVLILKRMVLFTNLKKFNLLEAQITII